MILHGYKNLDMQDHRYLSVETIISVYKNCHFRRVGAHLRLKSTMTTGK
jgi:hypothetical protein